ncbi:MAG: hypothetical protein FJ145_14475 [Deltaproteobacteria bacterium]|nr:hypothetical protein [Deltaproteobacteria bacterium]
MNVWYTLSASLHLVAIALWLGGIAFFLVVYGPAVHQLEPNIGIRALHRGRLAFEKLSWLAIIVLLITGIANIILRSHASNLPLAPSYMLGLSIKLFLFLAMVVHHCLQVFKYGPQLAALTERAPTHAMVWPEELRAQWQRWFTLLKINATLGPIVILMGLMLTR